VLFPAPIEGSPASPALHFLGTIPIAESETASAGAGPFNPASPAGVGSRRASPNGEASGIDAGDEANAVARRR
jgi:hypothetical protein